MTHTEMVEQATVPAAERGAMLLAAGMIAAGCTGHRPTGLQVANVLAGAALFGTALVTRCRRRPVSDPAVDPLLVHLPEALDRFARVDERIDGVARDLKRVEGNAVTGIDRMTAQLRSLGQHLN